MTLPVIALDNCCVRRGMRTGKGKVRKRLRFGTYKVMILVCDFRDMQYLFETNLAKIFEINRSSTTCAPRVPYNIG